MTQPQRTVAVLGWYGFDNAGDEAILSMIVSTLKRSAPSIKIIVFSGNPQPTTERYQVEAIDRSLHPKNWLSQLRAFGQADAVIIGGGGILTDLLFKSLPYYLGAALLARILRKRTMLYGVGVGPLRTPFGKLLARHLINGIDIVTVRDRVSYDLLKKIGVSKPLMYVATDPASLLPSAGSSRVEEIMRKEGIIRSVQPLIGVCLRSPPEWYAGREYYSGIMANYEIFKRVMSHALDHLITRLEATIVFIPMRRKEDNEVAEEIVRIMSCKYNTRIVKGCYTPEEVKGLLGQMDMVIGMRLHSVIFASTMQVPIVAIKYADKVLEFMKVIDQCERVLDIGSIDLDRLLAKIEEVWSRRGSIKQELASKIRYLQNQAQINNEQLLKLLRLTPEN